MKNKLEVEITRDGREVTAKCIHLDEEYIGKGDLINNGVYFISSDSEIEIRDCFNTLFVWGQYTIEEDSVAECLFSTEQEAIEYVENISKLIDEFNAEEVKATPKVVITEEMLSQDEIDKDDLKIIEMVSGSNLCNNGWKVYLYYNGENLETVQLYNSLFDSCLYYTINKSEDIKDCNEALKQIGIKARIIDPRKTITVKSVDGVEFEVYLDELNNIKEGI